MFTWLLLQFLKKVTVDITQLENSGDEFEVRIGDWAWNTFLRFIALDLIVFCITMITLHVWVLMILDRI
jgi:hypothetical protein